MNLKKAIEIIKLNVADPSQVPSSDFRDALKLLIEAGERIIEARVEYHSVWGDLLPGETED